LEVIGGDASGRFSSAQSKTAVPREKVLDSRRGGEEKRAMESTPPSFTPPPPPGAQPQPAPGWWGRNWKWFVPTGCCLTPLVLGGAFLAFLVLVIFGAMKQTDVDQTALARAKSNSQVIAALGQPISEGWFLSGSTKVDGSSGTADLSIPISGPKGKGTIYAVATKSAGEWSYSKLTVKIDSTGETIDLSP
jgi:hypothetical protein